ncbi:hypothetical protein NQ318_014377 [Aromia moschata]|uniref:Uncharacterized protein n=1 Tax=Aromia moschata TaxID=1265417 RepID=A0AAV8Z1M1_9CUCU|nr:hypothetical protein NQ318_014377 [Aromia moschata]
MGPLKMAFERANFKGHEAARRYLQLYPNTLIIDFSEIFTTSYAKLDLFAQKSNHGTPKTIPVEEEDSNSSSNGVSENPCLSTQSSAKCGNGAKPIVYL